MQRRKIVKAAIYIKDETQTVFGQDSEIARLFIIGEIPGDKKDEQGAPFVGSTGAFLRNSIKQVDLGGAASNFMFRCDSSKSSY